MVVCASGCAAGVVMIRVQDVCMMGMMVMMVMMVKKK
jgi:hypothetical protein